MGLGIALRANSGDRQVQGLDQPQHVRDPRKDHAPETLTPGSGLRQSDLRLLQLPRQHAPVAQRIEQEASNFKAAGSSPAGGTYKIARGSSSVSESSVCRTPSRWRWAVNGV